MDSVGGYAVTYFALLVVFGAYFVVSSCGSWHPSLETLHPCLPCTLRCSAASQQSRLFSCPQDHARHCLPPPHQLNLFLAVLKIKFAKAQSLLVDKRKAAKSTERPSSIIRLTKWVLARWGNGQLPVDATADCRRLCGDACVFARTSGLPRTRL